MVYTDGSLQKGWSSWSWGLDYQNYADTSFPVNGSTSSFCFEVQQFGALSLKREESFLAGEASMLGFLIRGGGNKMHTTDSALINKQNALGNLEIQLEASSPSGPSGEYSISQSSTLKELFDAQTLAETGSNDGYVALRAAAAGNWVSLRTWLSSLKGPSGGPRMYDRITIVSCLQRMDPCEQPREPVSVCLDQVVIISGV